MKIGIAVFAYNRNLHLSKTLAGLSANKEVKEIYVFQDGLKTESHRAGWEATKKVISDINWCKVNYILAEENKGLARSIVSGINYVLEENDAIVVLEDDCVPAPNFMCFMQQCFEKYQNNSRVYSISGYAWPIDIEKDEYDVYFTGKFCSWGWGTWKDRWDKYAIDNEVMDRIKKSESISLELAAWGNNLEQMFYDRINGKNDSWAVYWALEILELNGVCIVPYTSLIQNTGFDGSGVHCGKSYRYMVEMDGGLKDNFRLPDEVSFRKEAMDAFAPLYGSYTAVNQDTSKKKILVYGLGNYFRVNEQYLNSQYYIEAFIDRAKDGFYAGKKIIKMSEIHSYEYDAIVIMMQNIQECLLVAKALISEQNISADKIWISGGRYEAWP
jgi:GR25 family glycosyltransferase involved in LPS biosynthesis